ncbi:MAG: hypothetical protein HYZ75_07220 [Elusimicrobia bacterium]|nr:hypothetical protein [Elusimicrobiota bacterium]
MGGPTIELFYYDEKPAWRILVPHPARFKRVQYRIRFQLFVLPQGVLLGWWLRLYDVPDQPYFVHRVVDLGDSVVWDYMRRLSAKKVIVLVFESTGTEPGFAEELSVEGTDLDTLLREGEKRLQALSGQRQDGRAALDVFMGIFNEALPTRGDVGAAWKAVLEQYPSPAV